MKHYQHYRQSTHWRRPSARRLKLAAQFQAPLSQHQVQSQKEQRHRTVKHGPYRKF